MATKIHFLVPRNRAQTKGKTTQKYVLYIWQLTLMQSTEIKQKMQINYVL
jgi:hypothetical protein